MNAADLMEKIMEEAPSLKIDGVTYYVVEKDRKVREDQLMAYADEIVAMSNPATGGPAMSESLVVATDLEGRMMRWAVPARLTWAFDEASFAGHLDWLDKAKKMCAAATDDWNAAAVEQGVGDKISFAPAAAGEDPVFRFAYDPFATQPGLLAVAFFPKDPPEERVVFIGPGSFSPNIPYDKVGIIRHELGHVLGFRHEHIRPESHVGMSAAQKTKMEKWVTGGIGGQEISEFDGQSVMHYPLNGLGSIEFKLSDLDKKGFGLLYSMAANPAKLKEYPV